MRNIFLLVQRGLTARNTVRSGLLERLLEDPDAQIVILVPPDGLDILRAEFTRPRVIVEPVPKIVQGRFRRRIWIPFVRNLLFSETRRIMMVYGSGKMKRFSRWGYVVACVFYWPLSKLRCLRTLSHWCEMKFFHNRKFDALFEKYHPETVAIFSLLSTEDIVLMREAKRRGIRTVGMPKGWDALDKFNLEVMPDVLAAQNSKLGERAYKYHRFPKSAVKVVGFPFYDYFVKPEAIWTREETCAKHGLDPTQPYVIYGSEGIWSKDELPVVQKLVDWMREGKFGRCSLVIRPYFGNVKNHPFGIFRDLPGVVVDDKHNVVGYFHDAWDPSIEEIIRFANLMRHAALVVCVRSTMSLDSAALDIPCINVGYSAYINNRGVDWTDKLYIHEFYQDVMRTGGVEYAANEQELEAAIRNTLRDPGLRKEGRERLCDELCYKIDGQAAARLAEAILGEKA
jgi:hypothetical protein